MSGGEHLRPSPALWLISIAALLAFPQLFLLLQFSHQRQPLTPGSSQWRLTESPSGIEWRGELPGQRFGDRIEWRARAHWAAPGSEERRLLADTGLVETEFYPANSFALARMASPPGEGIITLELTASRNGGPLPPDRRQVSYRPSRIPAIQEDLWLELEDEIATASQYGVIWPEGEALLHAISTGDWSQASESDRRWAAAALVWAKERFVALRSRPDQWSPLPARSLANISLKDGIIVREFWTPGGEQQEPVLLLASRSIPGLAGLNALFAPSDQEQAEQRNIAIAPPDVHDAHPQLWQPELPDNAHPQKRWHASIQALAIRRFSEGRDLRLSPAVDPIPSEAKQAIDDAGLAVSRVITFEKFQAVFTIPAHKELQSGGIVTNWPIAPPAFEIQHRDLQLTTIVEAPSFHPGVIWIRRE